MGESQYILTVDDDKRVLFILDQALRALGNGYHVETAGSGEEALEKAKAKSYDILITDIVMPGMSGVELTEAVKDLHPDTMVVWITAHGYQHYQDDGERLGVYRCLEKPIRIADIRQAVVDAAEHAAS